MTESRSEQKLVAPRYQPLGPRMAYTSSGTDVAIRFRLAVNVETTRLRATSDAESPVDLAAVKEEVVERVQQYARVRKLFDDLQEHFLRTSSDECLESSELLSRIEKDPEASPASLICEAEITHFTEDQGRRLQRALWRFIHAHRDTVDYRQLVAVGAAIRKYVAEAKTADLEDLATLLQSDGRLPLPLQVELEIAKVAYRRFEHQPPDRPEPAPALASRLAELAELYLAPRLLARVDEGYATVGMLAAQALAVMLSERWDAVLPRVNEAPRWFRNQLARRLDQACRLWSTQHAARVADLAKMVGGIHRQ